VRGKQSTACLSVPSQATVSLGVVGYPLVSCTEYTMGDLDLGARGIRGIRMPARSEKCALIIIRQAGQAGMLGQE
jgi:hypothetical protein